MSAGIAERMHEALDWLESPQDELTSDIARLVRLAEHSASDATLHRCELLARALMDEVDGRALAASAEVAPPDRERQDITPAVGLAIGVGTAYLSESTRAWVLLARDHTAPVLLLEIVDGAASVQWLEGRMLEGLPRLRLIGLQELELVDMTAHAGVSGLAAARTSQPDFEDVLAATALGDVLDAAIDLGITLGFLTRIGEYSQRAVTDPAEVDQSLLEGLGAAYAELGVLSEALRESVAVAQLSQTPEPREWAQHAARARAFSNGVHGRLLSDLFELAGASATTERLGLDRSWRDFVTRQAVFPTGPAVYTENAIEGGWLWPLESCTWR